MKNLLKGALVTLAFFAFLGWLFRPVTGHLIPLISESGNVVGLEYAHVTWWGLRTQKLEAKINHGDVYFKLGDHWQNVPDYLYVKDVD